MSAETLVRVLFGVAALVNALPVVGALSERRLRALYDVELASPDLVVLMRHRAVLFAVVAGWLALAAFQAPLRPLAASAGLVSMLSFVALARLGGPVGPALRRVVLVDVIASGALVLAVVLDGVSRTPT